MDYAKFADTIACGGVNKAGKRIIKARTIETIKENLLGEESLKDIEITKEDIERVKKVKIANEVYTTDKVSMIMGMINSYLIDQDEVVYNRIDLIKSITLEDILNVKKDIDLDNYSFVIGYPKE